MAYNGSGVFNLYTPGNPVVTGTVISSTWANNTLSDMATGLSTAITKNGQTTTTTSIPFSQGLSAGTNFVVDASGNIAVTTNKFTVTAASGNALIAGTLTYGGVTLSAAVTGTGKMVLDTSPTLVTPLLGTPTSGTLTNCTGLPVSSGISGLGTGVATALAAGVTGSGNIVLVTSPTFATSVIGSATMAVFNSASTTVNAFGAATTLNIGNSGGTNTILGATTFSQALTLSAALTYGGVTLSNAVTGTGNMVLSASPTFTGTVTTAALSATTANLTGALTTTKINAFLTATPVTGTASVYQFFNNSGGPSYIGQNDSTGADLIGAAYSMTIQVPSSRTIVHAFTGVGAVTTTSTTGLAVTGTVTATGGATFFTTSTALTDGAGAGAGTILNAPSAGNPTKWIGINDNGTTRYIPAW